MILNGGKFIGRKRVTLDGNKDDNALLGFLNYDKIKTGKMRKQSEIWQQKRGCRALTLPILLKPIIRA